MAPRITKEPEERRRELVATAQQLFYTKGYERTSVSDIVNAAGVAQGTFYYYFDSKLGVLEAVVEELVAESLVFIRAIVADQTLDAIAKWNQMVRVINNWKIEQKVELIALSRVLHMDENTRLRYQLGSEGTKLMAPEWAKIIVQGVEQGVFDTEHALDTSEFALAIIRTASDALTDILHNPDKHEDPVKVAQRKVKAAQTAIERVLGAPSGSLPLVDEETMMAWFAD
jgi:AcrR family transcriptional regulator